MSLLNKTIAFIGAGNMGEALIRALLVRQVVEPVLWEQTMRNLLAEGIDQFYEIGPGRVLAGLLKRVQRQVRCENVAG